ncbi:hypothetical protein ACS0TY_019458 [Phlomoides rotata]
MIKYNVLNMIVSRTYILTNRTDTSNEKSTWDEKYKDRVNSKVFGEDVSNFRVFQREEEKKKAGMRASEFLEAALDQELGKDAEVMEIKEEDQKSLAVGIIGAPNAGKSSLTNFMVGSKVSAVSRKTNTTTNEVLGVLTKGDTQIVCYSIALTPLCFYSKPDSRVVRLIERVGSIINTNQKRVLCMNKVDLVEKKKVSGLKGAGIKDLSQYLMEQAVQRPWDEDPFAAMTEEVMKNISLEIGIEKLLDHVHQEVPYGIEHRLMGWKELNDGSIRIEQHFLTPKILVGKKGSKIGLACNITIHLLLDSSSLENRD